MKIGGVTPAKVLGIALAGIKKILGITVTSSGGGSGSSGGATLTDNFDAYSTGNLGGQGNWVAILNNLSIIDDSGDKAIQPNTASDTLVGRSETFDNVQSSQITLQSIVNGSWGGVSVRTQGSGATAAAYYYYAGDGDRYLEKRTPTYANIAGAYSATNNVGDTLKIEINGSGEIRCYHNGVLDTALNGTGIFIDTDIASGGTPGLYGYGIAGSMDEWIATGAPGVLVNIDFGAAKTESGWNVISQPTVGVVTSNLLDSNGGSTNIGLAITDGFNTSLNTGGTTSPDAALDIPSAVASDSLFGNGVLYSGQTEPTAAFKLTNLNQSIGYTIKIFASRDGVADNRECKYTISSAGADVVLNLNASNNTANIVTATNVVPNASGEILISMEPGSNNNNASLFYYIGAVKLSY